MTKASLTLRPPVKVRLPGMAVLPKRFLQSHGFEPLTMLPYETPRVPSVRRNSNQRGPKTFKTGYGRMRSRLGTASITPVVMPKSPRTDRHPYAEARRQDALVRQTQSWASARLR